MYYEFSAVCKASFCQT